MKFKIDENLPVELAELLRSAGYDAMTVLEQELVGSDDGVLVRICSAEQRILITFDTDFCDVRAYPPNEYCGLIVFRLTRQDKYHVMETAERLLSVLNSESPDARLWIVEERRVRIRGGS